MGDETQAHTPAFLRDVLRAARRPTWRRILDWALSAAGIGIAVWRLAPTIAAVPDLRARLAEVHWWWLAVAVPAGVGGLVLYGELHRHLLRVGGFRLGFRAVQAVNFISNTISLTLPSAGVTAGVAYSVEAYRRRGVDTGLSLWVGTLAALIAGAVMAVAGPLILAFDHLLPLTAAAALSGALALAIVAVWLLLRQPRSLRAIAHATTAVARHLPGAKAAKWVRESSQRADAVSERIALLRPGFGAWQSSFGIALLSWGLDYVSLVACVLACADDAGNIPWAAIAVGYLAVQASIAAQLTPAGAGAADSGLLAALVSGGLADSTAAVAVVLYRTLTWLLLALAGWVVFLVASGRKPTRRKAPRQTAKSPSS
ncbi:MAG TPA: lysylphosphatidylglycerol synthase transmembrane domain-containing protein [Pseudonocardiaceae bacterium]